MKSDSEFTGIAPLRNAHNCATAVFCCSGTTLKSYDDSAVPSSWPRFAVNEAIRKLGEAATYWVLSDDPIALEYGRFCQPNTTVLAMHEVTRIIQRHCQASRIFTTQSQGRPEDYADGVNFFSRGTVLIGALEMARYMGIARAYVFGLDCYRTRGDYYFDGRVPPSYSENHVTERQRVDDRRLPAGTKLYVTPRLKIMQERLREYVDSGLLGAMEVYVVGSPWSQNGVWPLISWEQFTAEHAGSSELSESSEQPAPDYPTTPTGGWPTSLETEAPPDEFPFQLVRTNERPPEPPQIHAVAEQPIARRRRGRPRKLAPETAAPSEVATPTPLNES